MKFSNNVLNKADYELERRRTFAQTTFEQRSKEISIKAPEISRINEMLVNTSIELSKAYIKSPKDFPNAVEEIKIKNLEGQRKIRTMLTAFGYPEDYLDIKYQCDICKDTGFVEGIRCKCHDELLTKYAVDELNKSCKIALHDFDEFNIDYYPDETNEYGINQRMKMQEVFDFCRSWTDYFELDSMGIFMNGRTGLGKTFLSSAIAKSLLTKGYSVAFDSISNFLRAIENEHFGRSNEQDTLQVLLDADLVILDDLGSEFNSPFYSSSIYNIINSRINRNKPTIISTNYTMNELQNKYDDRIISRITCSLYNLTFVGKDIRQIKQFYEN